MSVAINSASHCSHSPLPLRFSVSCARAMLLRLVALQNGLLYVVPFVTIDPAVAGVFELEMCP
jgi:hypothetical protein